LDGLVGGKTVKFRKKSPIIEAVQLLPETVEEVKKFTGNDRILKTEAWVDKAEPIYLILPHVGGTIVCEGEWIIKNENAENGFSICNPHLFTEIYERVEG
jgi:hypothetical protein